MSGVLIDANLLCLLVVGGSDPALIAQHSRLRAFGLDDYDNLVAIFDRLGDPVLCPHVLAETSNLIAYKQEVSRLKRLRESLAHIVAQCAERTLDSLQAVKDVAYQRLGLTDAILMQLAADRSLLLLSSDLGLCLEAQRRNLRVTNYNYVRDGALDIDQID